MEDNKSCEVKISTLADIDLSKDIKGLKAIQRQAKKATAALKELKEQRKRNRLLVIELSDENDTLPKVFYEGKELKYLSRIHLDWKTKSDQPGRLDVNVEYYELDENGIPILKGIGIDKCT